MPTKRFYEALNDKGRPTSPRNSSAEALEFTIQLLEAEPRLFNGHYNGVPSSINQLMPASPLAWLAFFQHLPSQELAADPVVFNHRMRKLARSPLWRDKPGAMLRGLRLMAIEDATQRAFEARIALLEGAA